MIRYYHLIEMLLKMSSQQVITPETLKELSDGKIVFMVAGLDKLVEAGIAEKVGGGYRLSQLLFDIVTVEPLYPGDPLAKDYNKAVETLNFCRQTCDMFPEQV